SDYRFKMVAPWSADTEPGARSTGADAWLLGRARKLSSGGPGRELGVVGVDVVLVRASDDRQGEVAVDTGRATLTARRPGWWQRHDDRPGNACRRNVDVSREDRRARVRDRPRVADRPLTRIDPDRGGAHGILVACRNLEGSKQRRRERPPTCPDRGGRQ